jgi:hypothetical protein
MSVVQDFIDGVNKILTGWGMHSGQSSPTSSKDFRKFVVIRVAGDDDKTKEKAETSFGKKMFLTQKYSYNMT